MNVFVFSAGILAVFTALVHVFAGQQDPVKPVLASNLTADAKATMLACWHMVSITLILCGCTLTYAGWTSSDSLFYVVVWISLNFVMFSVVFVGVGWFFFGLRTLVKLPQWILLLPIGALGIAGALPL